MKVLLLLFGLCISVIGISDSQAQPATDQSSLVAGLGNCIPAHIGRAPCIACHNSGRYSQVSPLGDCSACHIGPHQKQLAHRTDHGECDACHDVLGFVPVSYGVEAHRSSRFPLDGAHRAVACNACHRRKEINQVSTVQLRFETIDCATCHTRIPPGHTEETKDKYHCADCHITNSWQESRFDHGRTKFKLTGRHTSVACQSCHKPVDVGTDREHVVYLNMDPKCVACHQGPHGTQFPERNCEDCHTPDEWKPTLFDHQKQSSFVLTGKHLETECSRCHRVESGADGKLMRRFKPMNSDCRACHDASGAVLKVFSRNPGISIQGGTR